MVTYHLINSILQVMKRQRMVTELKQHEQGLLISREQLSHILEQNTDAIIVLDHEGIVRFANSITISLFGYEIEQNMSELFDLPVAAAEDAEIEVTRRSGGKITTEMRVIDIEWEGERAYLVLLRDVTKKAQAETETKCCEVEREWSNRELQQFAYVTSHKLQEPLGMIANYVQLLAQRYKGRWDADADDLISHAVDGVNHMQTFLDDLLAYSRVGIQFRKSQYTDCAEAVDRALANLHSMIEESGAVVCYGALPDVVFDRMQLVQLFQNLISNAIKFCSKEPPRVCISAERKNDEWIFSIRDNGIGIDPEYTERIFTILQRLHSWDERPGIGIGLAICRKIVESHGGRIWVESQPGKGATFYFTIPLYETSETTGGQSC